ncbi:fimbrial protein (plasmid) [Serratia marcescens]|uniref:fimbrial protein n=1 Tax=Serratia marcescens TaxID=615 RepID=UPI0006ED2E8B|nr:fimbrial protein [Serratia marcescens]ALL40416.1 fimbrial protein [Serratia marcescens]
MTNNPGHNRIRARTASDARYYLTLGGLALMVPLTLGAMLWLLPAAKAVDNWEVEGSNGTLYVHGAVTESACRLEMESARQDVALGEVSTGRLQTIGSRGTPVAVRLRLRDCLRYPTVSRDVRTGGRTWSVNQPAVTVSFNAPRDADNPQLVKAQGVNGLGLRMETPHGEDVRLGSRGKPLLLTPGQNTLTYTVTPERTAADLMAGSYRAVVDFHLSYD